MSFLENALVVLGCVLLLGALFLLRKLIAQLSPGRLRHYWYGLSTLIVFFIAGYAGYAVMRWNDHAGPASVVVPAIFFFGACFVLSVTVLSLRTAFDIRRVAVLEQENITDPLMEIYNRRYLERRLNEEVARANRYGLPLSILMIDIDHFKNINDGFGHQVGDLVLVGLGKLIGDSCRDSDIAARYGGEEIMVIAPNTTAASAVQFAERLRRAVESAALVPADAARDNRPVGITVSIGVSELGEHDRDVPAILASADKALYHAKDTGRNRVACNGSLDPSAPKI